MTSANGRRTLFFSLFDSTLLLLCCSTPLYFFGELYVILELLSGSERFPWDSDLKKDDIIAFLDDFSMLSTLSNGFSVVVISSETNDFLGFPLQFEA